MITQNNEEIFNSYIAQITFYWINYIRQYNKWRSFKLEETTNRVRKYSIV